jgi:hypothetical protein
MRGVIPQLPNTPSWRGAQLKYRDNFTFAHLIPNLIEILSAVTKIKHTEG